MTQKNGLTLGIVLSSVGLLATLVIVMGQREKQVVAERETAQAKIAARMKAANKRPLELGTTSQEKGDLKDERVMLNDPAITQAWGLSKADAARAWTLTQGSKDIVVAVIDTGIDVRHEDLTGNLWKNPGEVGTDSKGRDKSSNGLDDDGNGFVDDVYGWNFVGNNNNLADNHGHGTHIAGIIGAEAGNKKGIAGIAPKVSMMILKYYDPKVPTTDNLRNTINAIQYAIKNGAHIINYSGGGTEFSLEERTAVEEARQAGILFVAAAGNERSNSDQFKYYPADYGLSNIISVTAIDPSTEVLPSSNYGVETVDIAAPGQNIVSTLPGDTYGYMTGTSQATAFVTGGAVLVMAHKGIRNPDEVKKYLLATGDSDTSLLAKTRTSKKLNLFKSLTILDQGVSLSGVKAKFSPEPVSSSKSEKTSDPAADAANFGKGLMEALGKKNRMGESRP
jgi:thermitase